MSEIVIQDDVTRSVIAAASATQRQVLVEPMPGKDGFSIVRNVDVCAVGIEYPLSSGPATFTREDLTDVVASQDDPAVVSPRVWLGHPDDQRFHQGRTTAAGSAEPAIGKLKDLRVEDGGMTLVGDIEECPTWLANILSSAYPSRSVEGYQMATTASGREYGLLITDLALLGVKWPGVTTLSDLEALFSESGPDGVEVVDMGSLAAMGDALNAQAELEKVRRTFITKLPELKIPGFPWIRSILQDPNEFVIDDDEGGLYKLPYSVDPSGDVSFGELQPVQVQYVNASQAQDPNVRGVVAHMLTTDRKVAASWESRAAFRPDTDQEVTAMDADKLREKLGLPADATDEQVEQALDQLKSSAAPANGNPSAPAGGSPVTPPAHAPGDSTPGADPGAPPASPDQVPGEPESAGVTASVSLPEGMIAVPTEAWAEMQASVQSLAGDRERQRAEADISIVANAVREGKIFPHQRGHYEQRMKDPNTRDAFCHLLTASVDQGGLAPNLVPVEARGIDPATQTATNDQSAYPAEWLPEVSGDAIGGRVQTEA